MKNLAIAVTAAALVLSGLTLVGCDDKVPPAESPAKEKARADNGTKLRTYFDKCNGNFDALSPTDKAEVVKLVGTEDNARKAFSYMVPSRGAGAAPPGPPASGPGVR